MKVFCFVTSANNHHGILLCIYVNTKDQEQLELRNTEKTQVFPYLSVTAFLKDSLVKVH